MFILLLKWPLFEPKMPTVHCDESLIANGQCDQINIHANCSFDGGDCCTDVLIGNGK